MTSRKVSEDCWSITETGRPDRRSVESLGSAFLLGNGYLGYRGTLEEHGKDGMTAAIVSGLYDKVDDLWREPVNLPNPCLVQAVYKGTPLHAETGRVESHSQTLDLRRGVHERRTTFIADDGNSITVHAKRFVSLAEIHLVCLRYTVESSRDCALTVQAGIDGDVWDMNGPHLSGFAVCLRDGTASLSAHTRERGVRIAVCQSIAAPGVHPAYRRENMRVVCDVELSLPAGSPQEITLYAALYTGMDAPDPESAGRALSLAASREGFDALLQEHCALWEARWKRCGVGIQGDPDALLALRFSMYHLLSVAPAHAENLSIPARGLSGQMYKGAIFWDTEIFMVPFFAYTFPEIARNLLMYRRHTLEGARRKAAEYGFRGAFYAWESQDSGDDACTLFNVADAVTRRPIRTYFRDKQIHISADVVHAFWLFFSVTGDESILTDGGAEVIYECCRFLLTYMYYSREKDRYELLDVTGPDEYHERVHNNAYTNRMTAHAFEVCLRVSDCLREHHAAEERALMDKLDFHRDLDAIREASGRIYLPAPDPGSSVIPQFDGYFGLEDASVEEVLARKRHPHEYLGGGSGPASTTQVIKQADAVLALSLFSGDHPRDVKSAAWDYYEPRTEHGSSLSACAYALAAADIGRIEAAYGYFMKGASTDLDGEPGRFVGTLYIGGTHPASSGGAWMSAVFGLCGIRFSEGVLEIDPRLPKQWTAASVPVELRGRRLLVTISSETVGVEEVRAGGGEISVRVGNRTYALPGSGRLTVALHPRRGT